MLSLIVAMDKNGLIGSKNKLPWYLPEDLKRFKNITTGKNIVMGHQTYKSIGKPLPNRKNIILSRNKDLIIDDCIVLNDLQSVLDLNNDENEVIIIGGSQIYGLFLPYVKRMYITAIHSKFMGDTYFPKCSTEGWETVEAVSHKTNTGLKYSFMTLVKV